MEDTLFSKISISEIDGNAENLSPIIVRVEKLQYLTSTKIGNRNEHVFLCERKYTEPMLCKITKDTGKTNFYNLRKKEETEKQGFYNLRKKEDSSTGRTKRYSLYYESDESTSSGTDNELHVKQKINQPYKKEPVKNSDNNSCMKLNVYRNKRKINENLANETRLCENYVNNCLSENNDKTSSEGFNCDKNEITSVGLNCLSGSESSTEQDENELRQLEGLSRTEKMELSTHNKIKNMVNVEEILSERELEVLANNFASDSELECNSPAVRPVSSTSNDIELKYKALAVSTPNSDTELKHEAPAICPLESESELEYNPRAIDSLSSSSSYFESQDERSESPDIKTMEGMKEQNRRLIEESLSCMPDNITRTLNLEFLERSPVKLKLKRKIESPSSSDTSPKKSPQKAGSDSQSVDCSPSSRKLCVRRRDKSPKWIITNSEDKVEKKKGTSIKKRKKMSSWEVISDKTSQESSVSNNINKRTPLRDRSKIKLPAWRIDDDSNSKTLKICIPKYKTKSPVTLREASKEKENKTPCKSQNDNDSSVTTPPLRDCSKIKLPAWQQDDSKNTSDSSVNSLRSSSRIKRQLENKTPKKQKEDVTHDRNKNDVICPLRDRSKIKLPSWRQGDEYKLTSGKNMSPMSSDCSSRVSIRLSKQLHEDSLHANDNSILSTPKRGYSNSTPSRPLSSKKKRLSKKYVDSDSDSSANSKENSGVHFKNFVEKPSRRVLNHSPVSSKSCYEKKISITTCMSRKSGGRVLLTPKIEEKSSKIHGTTPSTPLDEARIQLHISTVPESLPCRQKEFKNIQGFLMRKIIDHAGGSMYISGMPGTGKTATVRAVIRALQQAADNNDVPNFDFVEVNGLKLTEPRQAYVRILQSLTGQRLTAEQAHSLLEKRFSGKYNKSVILFVDELDYLCNRRQDVIYNILDWPTKHNSGLIVLTVSNTMDLPERTLKGRVTSRMGLTRLTFQPYTHHQLQEIVLNRLAGNNCFHPDAIQLVARKVAAVSGDARRALDICRRATELVMDNEQITVKHIEVALTQIFTGPRIVTIRNCSPAAQLVLRALRDETQRTGVEETNVMQTYNHLVNICTLEGLPVPKVGDILKICTTLSLLGLVIAEKGRPDIMRKVSLNVNSDDIHYALSCA